MHRSLLGRRPQMTRVVAAIIATTLLVLSSGPARASAPPVAERRFGVMTQNLYLGANLTPLFGPTGIDLVIEAAKAYAHVVQTDFPSRATAIAKEISAAHPDVVGLQEVALWQTAPLGDPSRLTTTYDFQRILLDALAAAGHPYRAVAVNTNFSGALPISADTLVRFTDRDVIIVRADLPVSELQAFGPASGEYAAAVPVTVNGQPISIPRGWSSIDVMIRGKTYRFVNTHLEAFSSVIRALQARELVGVLASSPYPVVLAGDLNDFPGTGSVAILEDAGFVDGWVQAMDGTPGFTAGQTDDLTNVPSTIDHTVDYILHDDDGHLTAVAGTGEIVGEELTDRTRAGLWPSDHAGVVLTMHVAMP
jgi:endonuclease/exonuclease/phosphatase family metal-dependent hydrolase